jgi:hypothetical protein
VSDRERVTAAARRHLERAASRLMTRVHEKLLDTTPVDTGFAITNWIPSVGSPVLRTAGTYEEAVAGSLDRSPQQAGEKALRGYRLEQGNLYDVNNVGYIEKLNAGSSSQEPAAFVQAAIVQAIEEAK